MAGGIATCHVPHRIRDGYGMKNDAVERRRRAGHAADRERRYRHSRKSSGPACRHGLGIDVIVTDHHLPEAELPPAVAVVNPNRRDCGYPDKNLCGAGVALKLAEALLRTLGWERGRRERLVDFAAETGGDCHGGRRGAAGGRESRDRQAGPRRLAQGGESGAARVARRGGSRRRHRAQRAAGRLPNRAAHQRGGPHVASASDVVELFTTSDAAFGHAPSPDNFDELNQDRRDTEDGIRQAILEQCLAQPVTDHDAALVFAGEGWHRGVVGIVASRVVERYHRPVFVLGLDNGMAYGSGRSIRVFHLLEALEAMPELFTTFGGHRQAAGVAMNAEHVEIFRERFRAYAAERLTIADFEAELEIDAEISFREITDKTALELLDLAPFGFGNPPAHAHRAGSGSKAAPPEIKELR